jgi:hypothetical protein
MRAWDYHLPDRDLRRSARLLIDAGIGFAARSLAFASSGARRGRAGISPRRRRAARGELTVVRVSLAIFWFVLPIRRAASCSRSAVAAV